MTALQKPIVFRSTFAVVLTVIICLICLAGAVTAVVTGAGIGPVVLLTTLGWFVGLGYGRPHVTVGPAGVHIRNPFTDVQIPFDVIDAIDTRYTLQITAENRTWSAWGAPAPSGAGALRDSMRRGSRAETWPEAPRSVRHSGHARPGDAVDTASGAPATVIRREIERRTHEGIARAPEARTQVRRRTPDIVISVVLLAASTLSLVM